MEYPIAALKQTAEIPSSNSVPTTPESQRRVHSGPKERTAHLLEERGEGDGSESIPRMDSRA